MPEPVIVATARSPIGRANKGSLVDLRPDDMSAQILKALMEKAPQVQASDINDVMWGIGQPAGEGGFNIARVISSLAGLGLHDLRAEPDVARQQTEHRRLRQRAEFRQKLSDTRDDPA